MGVTIMNYVPVSLRLQVTLLSPMHIGSGFGAGKRLDDLMVVGPHPYAMRDLPYIPGSTLKGRLEDQLSLITAAIDVPVIDLHHRLFGSSRDGSTLAFDNAYVENQLAVSLNNTPVNRRVGNHDRIFVSLHRKRRVARENHLARIDVTDAGMEFQVTIEGWLPESTHQYDMTALAAAARLVTHLGAHKGRGLGHCRIDIRGSRPQLLEWSEWLGVE